MFPDRYSFYHDHGNNIIHWMECKLPLCGVRQLFSPEFQVHLLQPLDIVKKTDFLADAMCILDVNYKKVDINDVTFGQKHLILDEIVIYMLFCQTYQVFDSSVGSL